MNVFPVAKYLKKITLYLFSGKFVMKKWANMRDTWMKCHKKLKEYKSGSAAQKMRKYVFYDQMEFLKKIVNHRPTESNIPDTVTNKEASRETETNKNSNSESGVPQKKKKRKSLSNEIDTKMMKFIDSVEKEDNSRIMSFFRGIAPTVEKFRDEDLVEFQFEVMKSIRNIQHRNQASYYSLQPQFSQWSYQHQHRGYNTADPPSDSGSAWARPNFPCSTYPNDGQQSRENFDSPNESVTSPASDSLMSSIDEFDFSKPGHVD